MGKSGSLKLGLKFVMTNLKGKIDSAFYLIIITFSQLWNVVKNEENWSSLQSALVIWSFHMWKYKHSSNSYKETF